MPISLSTTAEHVGASTHALRPLFGLIEAHVMGAQRLYADDTRIPVLAEGRCDTRRLWTYVSLAAHRQASSCESARANPPG